MIPELRKCLVSLLGPLVFMAHFGSIYLLASFGPILGLAATTVAALVAVLSLAALAVLTAILYCSVSHPLRSLASSGGGANAAQFARDLQIGLASLSLLGVLWIASSAAANWTY